MKQMKTRIMVLGVIVGFLWGCGGPKVVKFEKLGLSVQLPAGWKADNEEAPTKYTPLRVEIRNQDRRTLIIQKFKVKADNFEAMEQALASSKRIKILDKEELDKGFGFTFQKGKKKLFLYYITMGDVTYECKPNDFYYDEKDVPAAIEIVKTIRKIQAVQGLTKAAFSKTKMQLQFIPTWFLIYQPGRRYRQIISKQNLCDKKKSMTFYII